jgi:hypothetical protein
MLNGKMDEFEWRIKKGFSSFERERSSYPRSLCLFYVSEWCPKVMCLFLNRARTSLQQF